MAGVGWDPRGSSTARALRIALFGGTGSAGSAVLRACLSDQRVAAIEAVTRRPPTGAAPKLRVVLCSDFRDLAPVGEHLVGLDACFYCLGVSQARVRDPARYREITYDYTMAAARELLQRSPACTFHFLTGLGTDATGRSRMMWARVKGEAERDLAAVGLGGAVGWRPGWIHPFHRRAGSRPGELASRILHPMLRRLPAWAVSSVEFGRAMLQAALEDLRGGVLENRDILALADRYRPPLARA